ncbi:hypothetical protein PHMEG_00033527 [Phytophthora megakarya]|uniref:Uncharacterized protein n=1 Tax=Phytophthora megakarya TaxID=4795 RepID=A0A225USY4_9STRA|nr:hypothetical protein PHMEG_00033527 [Phytophthora megakarya]
MDFAAGTGYLEIVQWLHTHRQEECTTTAMNEAAGNGHLEIVKWLHENRREGAMDWVINNGHLDVARWLYNNRSEGCSIDSIPIDRDDDRLKLITWLFEKFPTRFEESAITEAAEKAAFFGHLQILQFLASHERFDLFGQPEYFARVLKNASFSGMTSQ